MTLRALAVAALVAVSVVNFAADSLAQDLREEVAPAADGAGASDQHVDALGGALQVDTHAAGSMSGSVDGGTAAVTGELGASINGMGVLVGGSSASNPSPVPTPGESGPAVPAAGTAGQLLRNDPSATLSASGGARVAPAVNPGSVAAADELGCGTDRAGTFNSSSPDLIRAVNDRDRISLILLCDTDRSLTAAQLSAIRQSATLRARLGSLGFVPEDVVAVSLDASASGLLYVLSPKYSQ